MQAFLGPNFNINEFPCSFNLSPTPELRVPRLRTMKHTLTVELDDDTECEGERIQKRNLLSFIYFLLHKRGKAVELSNDLVELTQRRNVATLANRCFILWRNGDELEVRECRDRLQSLKNENDFHVLFIEAKAEQAYYYSRLGGTENLRQAEMLFSRVVNEVPTNYLWKYGLGLACRRAMHGNIVFCRSKPVDLDALIKKAIKNLVEVADKGDNSLKSIAYAELVILRQVHTSEKFPKYDVLFRDLSVDDLVDRALDNDGKKIPSVLTQCGKALQWENPDKSIELLEKSVAINPKSSMSYHFLGKSYKRKAQWQLSKGCLSPGDPETDSVGQSIGGGGGSVGQSIGGGGGSVGQSIGGGRGSVGQSIGGGRGSVGQSIGGGRGSVGQSIGGGGESVGQSIGGGRGSVGQSIGGGRGSVGQSIGGGGGGSVGQSIGGGGGSVGQSIGGGGRGSVGQSIGGGRGVLPRPPLGSPGGEQNGFHDNKGMNNNSRGRSNFTRSFSSPTTAYGTNRRFPRAGSNSRRRGQADSFVGRSLSEYGIIASSRKPSNQAYLNGDDEFVKKAVSFLKKAIEVSDENLAAILDLGILLNETGKTRDALQQFNKVTNSKLASKSNRVSAISAFEQSGLCYLELGKAGPRDKEDEEAGKRKLTQAVSLAAELALSMPELQGKTQDLWTAFETLMNKIDEEQSSSTYIKDKVKLLELAKNYGQIINIFQNIPALTGNELSDKEMVTIAIKSYHNESKFEDALALQNIISLRPDVRESDWWKTGDLLDLRIKSLLRAAAGRLERATDTPIGLFQQVFQLVFGACFGAQDEDEDIPQAGGYVGDVLVVFNDDEEVDNDPDSSTVTSLGLQQVATSLFGLKTRRNLEGNMEFGGFQYETQLQEMRKYQVVVIVLGSETRYPQFDAMLENVFVNIDQNEPTNQRTLIIDAGLGDGPIPLGMTHYKRFKLTNMSGLRCADTSPDNEGNGDELSYVDILQRGFNGDVKAVMELFCFMVGKKWQGS